ncbi:MAG: MucB/RseB C-terminal domain-containing protein [Gammaproteobacteria bacterium]|nr:MucB/RseB C-terminal domain-containing protein [Gammaproteobacteria bacterium]
MHASPLRHGPVPGLACGVLFMIAGALQAASAADTPRALLELMGEAIERVAYEGTFVHVQGDDSSAMHVSHQLQDGRIVERVSCEDAGRELIRDAEGVTGIFADQRTVLVEPRAERAGRLRSPLSESLAGPSEIDDALYLLALGSSERIAGRDTRGIVIRPRDGFRYGYRLWLDRETHVPLKTQLVDERGQVLEQILFTQISYAQKPAADVQPAVSAMAAAGGGREVPPAGAGASAGQLWVASRLPPGFRLTARQARIPADAPRDLQQVVYSDGLATVSLFVEPAIVAIGPIEGLSQVGAANAYTITMGDHMVTAMGEVPVRTVRMLATSTRRVGDGTAAH